VSPPKTAEPLEMPLGLWTRVGPGNHRRAHWRNLANMFEPSMCRGDVAFLSITLTTIAFKSLSSLILFHHSDVVHIYCRRIWRASWHFCPSTWDPPTTQRPFKVASQCWSIASYRRRRHRPASVAASRVNRRAILVHCNCNFNTYAA